MAAKKIEKTYAIDWGIAISSLLGALFFLVLLHDILPPTRLDWILTDGWDTFQHQVGWEFFRTAPWSWPIGLASNYGFPVGLPITYTDSIPLLAIPFKLLRTFLPETFQYLGLWHFIAFILQGIFGYLLCRLILHKRTESIIGSLFFIASPIMLYRVAGHASLVGHFLILASLWLIFRRHDAVQSWQWGMLLAVSLLVHPYFLFMAAPLWLADSIILILKYQSRIMAIVWQSLIILAALFIVASSIGIFYIGDPKGNLGFGDPSMNLNALFNSQGWSLFLPDLPMQPYQYEGFNYLGVGIIFSFILSVIIILIRDRSILFSWLCRFWPVLLICLLFAAVSVSHKIYFGNLKVIEILLPEYLKNAFGVVQSSGRFFWPVYYLLVLFSLMIARYLHRPLSIALLVIVVIVQLFDISMILNYQYQKYANRTWNHYLTSEFWQTAAKRFSHIAYIPEYDPSFENYTPIALFAVRHGLTLNTGYFSRNIKGDGQHIEREIELLRQGIIDPETIYIFTDEPQKYLPPSEINNIIPIGKVGAYGILVPHTLNDEAS